MHGVYEGMFVVVVGRGWEGWRLRGGTEWSALVHLGGGSTGGVNEASREGGKASGLLADLGKTGGWIWIWSRISIWIWIWVQYGYGVILVCGYRCWALLVEPSPASLGTECFFN